MEVVSFICKTQVNGGALCRSEGWFRKPLWHIFMRIAENIEAISPKLWLLCAPLLNITTAKMRLRGRLCLRKSGNSAWLYSLSASADNLKCYVNLSFSLAYYCHQFKSWHSSCWDSKTLWKNFSPCPQWDSLQMNLSKAMLELWAPKCKYCSNKSTQLPVYEDGKSDFFFFCDYMTECLGKSC